MGISLLTTEGVTVSPILACAFFLFLVLVRKLYECAMYL